MALTRVLPTLVDDVPASRGSAAPRRSAPPANGASSSAREPQVHAVAGLLATSSGLPRTVRAARLLFRLGLGAAISFGAAFLLAEASGWPAVAFVGVAFVLTTVALRVGATRWRPVFARRVGGTS